MPQPSVQPPSPDLLAAVVRRYREEELQLSQADFAWLAAVSRGTISNLETGRVTPDERTWHRIRTVLALPPVSLAQARDGVAAPPIISGEALRGIVSAILAIRDRDPDVGRRTAERWRRLVIKMTRQDAQAGQGVSSELTWLAHDVAPMAPDRAAVIQEALAGWGGLSWPASPDATVLRPAAPEGLDHVQQLVTAMDNLTEELRACRERMQGFERLPGRLQDLLSSGFVIQYEINRPDAAPGITNINLIVANETDAADPTHQQVHDAARRWSAVVAVATHIIEKQAPQLSPEEITRALKSGLDAQSPVEVRRLLPGARSGDPAAMYDLARVLRKGGRPDEAELWLRRAAQAGHPGALYNLGNLACEDGRWDEAERCLRSAAEARHPDAMYQLWSLLRDEKPSEAERWLRRAANAGNRTAMYNLWHLTREGGNTDAAEKWLRLAANAGHREALADVSKLVQEKGPEAEDEAVRWLRRAAEAGDSGAMSRYELQLYEQQQRRGLVHRAAG
jgi:tetratricopeptide (TPR) repeat protein/DNA-binding XRE family transcriptional regulator